MNEDSPYGDLFDLPTGTGDIDFENPTSQDLARIQQDPNLQMQYLQNIMGEGHSIVDEYYKKWEVGQQGSYQVDMSMLSEAEKQLEDYFSEGGDVESFMNLSDEDIRGFLNDIRIDKGMGVLEGEQLDNLVGYFQDLQTGMGKLQSGDFGIESLQRELGLAERGVTGPGGLTQQKGSMADMLQQKIGTRRQSYVPQEKTSRYGQVTGTGGGVDPTQSYLSGVEGDVSAYGTSIAGVDKSIYDILYGTEAGSIHDIYGQYGEGVKGSLFGPGGDLWYE